MTETKTPRGKDKFCVVLDRTNRPTANAEARILQEIAFKNGYCWGHSVSRSVIFHNDMDVLYFYPKYNVDYGGILYAPYKWFLDHPQEARQITLLEFFTKHNITMNTEEKHVAKCQSCNTTLTVDSIEYIRLPDGLEGKLSEMDKRMTCCDNPDYIWVVKEKKENEKES